MTSWWPLLVSALVSGWLWHRWSRERVRVTNVQDARRALPELVEMLAIGVSAGATPAHVLVQLDLRSPPPLRPITDEIAARVQRGYGFVDAVTVLRDRLGLDAAPLVDLLVSAHRDGLSVEPLLARLAAEARTQRRRDAEADARRLPVRLAAPLVLCTLPGFVLLAIVPLVAGALSSLSLP